MAVSYNKMSSIQVAGSYANYIPSGTFLGNVSLDISGRTFLRNDTLINAKLFVVGDTSLNNLAVSGATDISGTVNINTTGTPSTTSIGSATATSGNMEIRGNNIGIIAYNSLQLEATNGFWTNVGAGNFYYRSYNGIPNIIMGNETLSTDYLYITAQSTGSEIDAFSQPFTLKGSSLIIDVSGNVSQDITNSTITNNPSTDIFNQINGADRLTITDSTITNNPTTTILNKINGGDRLTITNTNVTINPTTQFLAEINGADKLTITDTNVTINPTTQFLAEINATDKLTITSTTTTLDNTTININANTAVNVDNTFNMMPTATIITNVSSTVPSGFLYCNGQAVSRTVTYARLFAAIGTTFGVGNGSTTFNVPNFLGCFLRGASNQTIGGVVYTAGAVGTAQQDSVLEAYNEGYWSVDSGGGGSSRQVRSRVQLTGDPEDTGTNSTTKFTRQNATENRPVNHAVYYYIRY